MLFTFAKHHHTTTTTLFLFLIFTTLQISIEANLTPNPEITIASSFKSAAEAHSHALTLAMAGTVVGTSDSIYAFERAIELAPDEVSYLNDLAVSYLRTNEMEKALALLYRAYYIDSNHLEVISNIEATREHMEYRMGKRIESGGDGENIETTEKKVIFDYVEKVEEVHAIEEEEVETEEVRARAYEPQQRTKTKSQTTPAKQQQQQPIPQSSEPLSTPEDISLALSSHSTAMDLAMANKLNEALPFFIKTVALDPSNFKYLNDLGVTYLRLYRFEECKSALDRAYKISPNMKEVVDNLRVLQEHVDFEKERIRKNEFQGSVDDDRPRIVVDQRFANAGVYDEEEDDE